MASDGILCSGFSVARTAISKFIEKEIVSTVCLRLIDSKTAIVVAATTKRIIRQSKERKKRKN